jgi:uncharacterized membrane-anchored protein
VKEQPQNSRISTNDAAWLSMRSALITMGVISLALAAFIAWNAVPTSGILKGSAVGGLFGLASWLVFYGAYRFFKWSRGS